MQEPGGVIRSGLSLGSLFMVALFVFAGFPRPYNFESYVDLLRLVPGGLQSPWFYVGGDDAASVQWKALYFYWVVRG